MTYIDRIIQCGGSVGVPDHDALRVIGMSVNGIIPSGVMEIWSEINGAVIGNYGLCSYSGSGITTNCLKRANLETDRYLTVCHDYGEVEFKVALGEIQNEAIYFCDSSDGWLPKIIVASSMTALINGLIHCCLNSDSKWPYDKELVLHIDPLMANINGRFMWNE